MMGILCNRIDRPKIGITRIIRTIKIMIINGCGKWEGARRHVLCGCFGEWGDSAPACQSSTYLLPYLLPPSPLPLIRTKCTYVKSCSYPFQCRRATGSERMTVVEGYWLLPGITSPETCDWWELSGWDRSRPLEMLHNQGERDEGVSRSRLFDVTYSFFKYAMVTYSDVCFQ